VRNKAIDPPRSYPVKSDPPRSYPVKIVSSIYVFFRLDAV
jgi:hypothetical protein